MDEDTPQNLNLLYKDFFDDGPGETNKPKACSKCNMMFKTNGILDIHWQKVHEAPPLLNCSDCSTDFRRKMGKFKIKFNVRHAPHYKYCPLYGQLNFTKLETRNSPNHSTKLLKIVFPSL